MTPKILLFLSFALVSAAPAALVNISANTLAAPARTIITSSGALLPVGSAVRIGTFPAGAPVITPASTFASVNALFVPLAENSTSAADGTTAPLEISSTQGAGKYAGTISNVDNSDSRFSEGTALYVFVLNSTYSALSSATEWAIFRDSAWTIPGTATRTMTTSQIDVQGEMIAGTQSTGSLQLAPIPEPTVSLLALCAMAACLRRRR